MQYKSVSPVGDRVFVKVDTSEATSQGGILLPTSAQKKPTQGEIVGLGDVKSLKVKLLYEMNVQGSALGAEHVQRTRLLRCLHWRRPMASAAGAAAAAGN